MKNLIIGLIFSSIIAFGGYKRQSLSLSGALSAIILGTLIFYLGGLYFAAIMVAFFLSSSVMTKFKSHQKQETERLNEKGGRRDITQVAANGSLGLVYALLFYFSGNPMYILGYASAFASSNSDTWASEIGVLSKKPPVSILTLKPMRSGLSGGISLLGTFASLMGAGFIAVLAALGHAFYYGLSRETLLVLVLCTAAGFTGSIIDSILGASVQAKYQCTVCGELTEKKFHHNTLCTATGGISFFTNDMVNFLSGLISSLLAILVYVFI